MQGRIQDFKLGGAHLKKILRKKIIFFPILGGGARRVRPPLDPLLVCMYFFVFDSLVCQFCSNIEFINFLYMFLQL